MPNGFARLWDTEHFQPFPLDKDMASIVKAEAMMYCNSLERFLHIDVYFLVKEADDIVIRTLINYDS